MDGSADFETEERLFPVSSFPLTVTKNHIITDFYQQNDTVALNM